MNDDEAELDYGYFTQNALRGVVRDVLAVTAEMGQPPGEHHFFIEFLTNAMGVSISDSLKEQYPERMTIVLQHQFEDLIVNDNEFSVTLHFNQVPATLVIPFVAVTQFADPSVNFALQFPVDETLLVNDGPKLVEVPTGPSADVTAIDAHRETTADAPAEDESSDDDGDGPDDDGNGGGADVVSLDRFRKK